VAVDHVDGSVLGNTKQTTRKLVEIPEIPDRGRALAEIHRVLGPTGVLSISEDFLDPDDPFRSETIRLGKGVGYTLDQGFGGVWLYALNFRKLETSSRRAREITTADKTDSKVSVTDG
jgi:ubiquinone/menaquinone biosynthesis C-methylase UbiE